MKVLRLGTVEVRVWPESCYLETVFPDGSKLGAAPQDTETYREHALQMGYSDTWHSCLAHELLHTLYAQAQGKAYSLCLWKAANGGQFDAEDYEEETAVLDIQKAIGVGDGHELSGRIGSLLKTFLL